MEYVKFDSGQLNFKFSSKTKKEDFTMQDLLSLDNEEKEILIFYPITQHDLDILSQLKIPEISFSEIDLLDINFENCTFSKINFYNCNLEGTKIANSSFSKINFYNCNLEGTKITNSSFNKIKFDNCNLKDAKITESSSQEVSFLKINSSNLSLEKCNINEAKFGECNLDNITINETTTQEVSISINDFCEISQEKIKELQQKLGYNLHFISDFDNKDYTLNEFSSVISIMEEIKSSIPENSSELEKFLFVYNILGKNIEYDRSGCIGNEFYTKEASILTRSLFGALVNGKAVCVGFARALSQVLKYIGIESEPVSADVHCLDGESGGHCWSKVKIDGSFYYSDLTWDYRYLDELTYCLKSPLDEKFREEHDELTNDLHNLKRKLECQTSSKSELDFLFDSLFPSSKDEDEKQRYDHEPTDYELCIKSGYATENYNPEIIKETIKKVRGWTDLEQSLKTIEELKNAPEKKKTIDISDINDVISTVKLNDYINVQQDFIKEKEKTNNLDLDYR